MIFHFWIIDSHHFCSPEQGFFSTELPSPRTYCPSQHSGTTLVSSGICVCLTYHMTQFLNATMLMLVEKLRQWIQHFKIHYRKSMMHVALPICSHKKRLGNYPIFYSLKASKTLWMTELWNLNMGILTSTKNTFRILSSQFCTMVSQIKAFVS